MAEEAGHAAHPEPVTTTIPHVARVHLAHATVQRIAEQAQVSLLHLKGPAVMPGLRPEGRQSSDVDVLVRPGHFERFEAALRYHGWTPSSHLETGSAFAHAANWWHDDWGYVDAHALWPGPTVSPEEVYAAFAEEGFDQPIAHYPCPVPGRTAQILVLLLHTARGTSDADLDLAWRAQSEEQQRAVLDLAARLGAQVALSAALGGLEEHRGDSSYELWRFYREGGGRLDEWRARYRAASTPSARLRVLLSAVRVNRDHLRGELGHAPTRADVRRAQRRRVARLGREATRAVTDHVRRRP